MYSLKSGLIRVDPSTKTPTVSENPTFLKVG
jgi:hypothetical protein